MITEEFQLLATELKRFMPHQRELLVVRLHMIEHIQVIGVAFKPLLISDAVLCVDSGKALEAAGGEIGIAHRPWLQIPGCWQSLSRSRCEPTQRVNAPVSRQTHYLANDLGWRRLIDRIHGSLSVPAAMLSALGINSGQKLKVTWAKLINQKRRFNLC